MPGESRASTTCRLNAAAVEVVDARDERGHDGNCLSGLNSDVNYNRILKLLKGKFCSIHETRK
jgi:hypothetical protein